MKHEPYGKTQEIRTVRNTIIGLATRVATKRPPISSKIRAQGLRIFTDGRRIRVWPAGLLTQAQRKWLEAHQTALVAENHSLWTNSTRCRDCGHNRPSGCLLRLSPGPHEGGFHPDDLHYCEGYQAL